MTKPTPFTEEDARHKGWHVYNFTMFTRGWRLTTIDNGREPAHSLLVPQDDNRDEPWPRHRIMHLDGIVSVEVCADVLRAIYAAFEAGKARGVNDARADMRASLGLR